MAPSTVTVPLLPTDFPLPMIWCWSFGILWIFTFWIIACSCAACSLGYFGFLRASEFTIPNLSSLHLGVQDIAVDSPSAPSCMRISIKGSRSYPLRKGCFIHIGVKRHPLSAALFILHSGVMVQASCFCYKMDSLSSVIFWQAGFGRLWLQLRCRETSPATAFA